MMQRRMTAARIPPVITTVPAVIRPMPHPTLWRDAGLGWGRRPCWSAPHRWRLGGVPGTETSGGGCGQGQPPTGLTAQRGWRGGRMLTEGAILLPVPASFKASYSLSPLMLFSLPVPPHHTLLTLYPFHHPVVPRHTQKWLPLVDSLPCVRLHPKQAPGYFS